MVFTFRTIVEQVMAQIDERTDTDTTLALVKEYVNSANALRAVEMAEHFLIENSTLTTVSGQQDYTLTLFFDKPIYFYNNTVKSYLTEIPNRTLEPEWYYLTEQQGTAQDFLYWGMWPVRQQPTTPGVISLVSDNAADVGASYQVAIKGEDVNGELVIDILPPSGLSVVTGSVTFARILDITKTGATNGNLTFTSGAQTLLTLSPSNLGNQYRVIHFLASPTSPQVIQYRYYRKPVYMINDYDKPDIPYPYSQVLVFDALLMLAGYNTDTAEKSIAMWQINQQRWADALRNAYRDSQTGGARSKYVRGISSWWVDDDA